MSDYPALVAYIVNLLGGAVIAFGFLPATTAHAVATAVVALTSLVVAVTTRPIVAAVATGAFNTFIVSLAGFGLHWSDTQVSAVVGLFGFAIAVITHHLVTTAKADAQGTTVYELRRARAEHPRGVAAKVAR